MNRDGKDRKKRAGQGKRSQQNSPGEITKPENQPKDQIIGKVGFKAMQFGTS